MSEMDKLIEALNKREYDFQDVSDEDIDRIHFTNNQGVKVSVVIGLGTYGADKGLLETMPPVHEDFDEEDSDEDDVEGWLTADEIIKAWL